jgi:hypothetical protein
MGDYQEKYLIAAADKSDRSSPSSPILTKECVPTMRATSQLACTSIVFKGQEFKEAFYFNTRESKTRTIS